MPVMGLDEELTEKCAVFGIYNAGPEAARLAFYGLWALQHRGQESSGIASTDGDRVYRHAAAGLVANVYHEEDLEQLPGTIAIGHNRYSTSGGVSECHLQPFVDYDKHFALAHNGNLPEYDKLNQFLEERGVTQDELNDSGMMAAAVGCYIADGLALEDAIIKAYPLFEGVFSAVALDRTKLVAFRDQCGIRPLSIGRIGDGYVVASETCAFDTIGATYLRDVEPGELVVIDENGITSHQVVKPNPKLDIFEFVYFARPDSLLLGKRVDEVRKNFGREMAKEFNISADVVIPVPDSAIPAALGYSQTSGVPFEMAIIKNRYIHRTFIRPTAELRERDLQMKLNAVEEHIRDKRIILVDDSIVRGTTMRKVVKLMFDAGASEVHLAITCPPVMYPDFYGINTPNQEDLIASHMSNEEMREYIGATSLNFLSFDATIRATGLPVERFSCSCFDGVYPISIGSRVKEIARASK